jgi:predicted metal-dependent phosphoesterase TrpH
MNEFLNVDLHCHSAVSDGMLAPAVLAARAHANGVDMWSLTDHDEIGGQREAAAAARALGLRYVTGVEISVTWANETIHIVGLGIDPDNLTLTEGLAATRNGRLARAQKMADGLAAVGIPGAFEGALKFVGNPDLISRTHFARFLVERRTCRDVQDVFNKYLVEGKPGYVPMHWATLAHAVGWILGAGGVAVVAHPGRYPLSELELHALLQEFRDLGGSAIEVVTGSHTPEQYRKFAGLAADFGFAGSRGSDFHGPNESRIDLGKLPPLPEQVRPVWQAWA